MLFLCEHALVYDRNMANFKNSFNSPKAVFFQIQLCCFSPNVIWIAAMFYCIVAPTGFAQISLFFIIESAFYSFFAPAFWAFKFFLHTLILQHVFVFSNARNCTFDLNLLTSHYIKNKNNANHHTDDLLTSR